MTLQFLRPGRHKGGDRATRRIQKLLASALAAPVADSRTGLLEQAATRLARAAAEPVRPTRHTKSLRPVSRGAAAARRNPRIVQRLLGFGGLSSLTRRR